MRSSRAHLRAVRRSILRKRAASSASTKYSSGRDCMEPSQLVNAFMESSQQVLNARYAGSAPGASSQWNDVPRRDTCTALFCGEGPRPCQSTEKATALFDGSPPAQQCVRNGVRHQRVGARSRDEGLAARRQQRPFGTSFRQIRQQRRYFT